MYHRVKLSSETELSYEFANDMLKVPIPVPSPAFNRHNKFAEGEKTLFS
jgi:hypothetical protein